MRSPNYFLLFLCYSLSLILETDAGVRLINPVGQTVVPNLVIPRGIRASFCPYTHPYTYADNKHCCAKPTQIAGGTCVEGQNLSHLSGIECCHEDDQITCPRKHPGGPLCRNHKFVDCFQFYTYYDNEDEVGATAAQNPTDCQLDCKVSETCEYFRFGPYTGCMLLTTNDRALTGITAEAAVSGPKECP